MKNKTNTKKATIPDLPAAPKETREAKLARLATKRVNNAMSKLRLIGNLAAYKPTDEQINKIMQQLGESCARIEDRLRMNKAAESEFTL